MGEDVKQHRAKSLSAVQTLQARFGDKHLIVQFVLIHLC